MKRIICLLMILAMVLCVAAPVYADESEYLIMQELLDASMLLPAKLSYENAVFAIDNTDYSVHCYHGADYEWQWIVNQDDSALILPWNNSILVLADHYHQGFSMIRDAEPFMTAAVLSDSESCDRYICVAVIPDAYNAGNYLAYSDWSSIEADYPNSLITYTCNTDYAPGTITVTVWYMLPEEYNN